MTLKDCSNYIYVMYLFLSDPEGNFYILYNIPDQNVWVIGFLFHRYLDYQFIVYHYSPDGSMQ